MINNPKNHSNDVLTPSSKSNEYFSVESNSMPVPVNTGEKQVARDEKGQFLKGKSPNPKGRPKGARNRLTETFMRVLTKDFEENGGDALIALRETNPEAYLRCIISVMPKKHIQQWEEKPDIDYANITEEEFRAIAIEIHRQKEMQNIVESMTRNLK